eukprot:352938-Chlamydomonas_euryale.AAC.4
MHSPLRLQVSIPATFIPTSLVETHVGRPRCWTAAHSLLFRRVLGGRRALESVLSPIGCRLPACDGETEPHGGFSVAPMRAPASVARRGEGGGGGGARLCFRAASADLRLGGRSKHRRRRRRRCRGRAGASIRAGDADTVRQAERVAAGHVVVGDGLTQGPIEGSPCASVHAAGMRNMMRRGPGGQGW